MRKDRLDGQVADADEPRGQILRHSDHATGIRQIHPSGHSGRTRPRVLAAVLAMMLATIDHYTTQITELNAKIEALVAPYLHQVAQLDAVPGAWEADERTRSSPSGSSAKLIATAVCEPLCGSTPTITAAINRSFVMSAGRPVAGMPNSGSAGVAPLTSHTTGDPAGRHLVIKPDRTRPAGGSGASPSGPLNATTKPQRLHPFSIRRVGARLSTIA